MIKTKQKKQLESQKERQLQEKKVFDSYNVEINKKFWMHQL